MLAAQTGDTWGIPGPTFIVIFLVASAASIALTLGMRWSMRSGRPLQRPLRPYEMAYLAGGERQVALTALIALHKAGAIETSEKGGVLAAKDTGTAGGGALDLDAEVTEAVLDGVRRQPRSSLWQMLSRTGVRRAVDRIRSGLAREGLLLDENAQARWKLTTLPMWLVVIVGVGRLLVGLSNDKPVGYLFATLIVLTVQAAVLTRRGFSTPTRAGVAALTGLRAEHRHLEPRMSPAWDTYGADSVVIATALFGSEATYSADPSLATALTLDRGSARARTGRRGGRSSGDGGAFFAGGSIGGGSCGGGGGGGDGGGGGGGGGGCGG